MQAKLTKRTVEFAQVPTDKQDVVIWDTEVAGFACRVTEAGGRHYQVFKRVNGRRVRYRLGQHGPMTAEEARKLARQVIAAAVGCLTPRVRC